MLATVSDKRLQVSAAGSTVDYYAVDVVSAQDYYPFGMLMPGRDTSVGKYRYGFNGKENDNEVKGEGNQQDYGMRIYDPRIGKFLSVDPLTKSCPWNSPYLFAENDVIRCLDLDGGERLLYLQNFQYNGSWTDYFKWLPNTTNNLYNGIVADTWNVGVGALAALGRGTYLKDLRGGFKQFGDSISEVSKNTYDYTVNTPVQQQMVDAGKGFLIREIGNLQVLCIWGISFLCLKLEIY